MKHPKVYVVQHPNSKIYQVDYIQEYRGNKIIIDMDNERNALKLCDVLQKHCTRMRMV